MANKPLKSIKFPGLSDTYTVPEVDNTLAVTGAAADAKKVGDEITDIKADLSYSSYQTKSAKFRLPLCYIDGSGKIVAASSSTGPYSYDMICYQVVHRNNISKIEASAAFTYGFFVDKPALGSVSYNGSRVSSGGALSVNNVIVPSGVNWIAIRVQHDDGILNIDKIPFYDEFSMLIRSVVSSGNMDDYTEAGFYVHQAGSAVDNTPDTGGVFFVGKLASTVSQIYVPNRASNEGSVYIRKIINGTAGEWFKYISESSSKRNAKIAFFGDSIIWGSIKTLNGSSFVTSQANPTIPQTMAKILSCDVDNYAVGGMGYITKVSGNNILKTVQSTNLEGYTHALFSAGDNDSKVGKSGIGTYRDTGTDTIAGQWYQIITYLHNNYPSIKPIFIDKNNKVFMTVNGTDKTYFGDFPNYYYDYTYGNNFSISALNEELTKFCEYYHIGHISQSDFSGGYNLLSLVGEDGTHFTQEGYNATAQFLAAQLTKYL